MSTTAISVQPTDTNNIFNLKFPSEVLYEIQAIEDEIGRAAYELFQQRGFSDGSALDDWLRAESKLLKPTAISVDEKKDSVIVTAEVSDFSLNELKVHVDGDILRICGKSEEGVVKDKGVKPAANASASVRRVRCEIVLPAKVDSKGATATLDKGVMKLILPKAQPAAEIEVKAAA